MYASSTGQDLKHKLATVDIAPIGGKTGQRLRNELIFYTTRGGEAEKPAYRLHIVLSESLGATLVRTTGEAASSVYSLEATFQLVDLNNQNKIILQGASSSRAAFDRYLSIYSNVRAAEDASARAAKTMADEIAGRVAAFLSSGKV